MNLKRSTHRLNEKSKDASIKLQQSIAGLTDQINAQEIQRALYVTIQIVEGYSQDDRELALMKRYKRLL